jgi:hypothetical protein
MRNRFQFWLALAAAAWLSGVALAAKGPGSGWGPGSPYNRNYDPATVATISGTVVTVERITPAKGMSNGVHLAVKTETGVESVHLGPAWYIDNQEVTIAPNDKVEVTGSRVTLDGKPAILAAEVTKGEDVLQLRGKDGTPYWSGWHKR